MGKVVDKKIKYNNAKLSFKEEQRGSLTVITCANDKEKRIVVNQPKVEDPMWRFQFIGFNETRTFKVQPVGDTTLAEAIALAQCFYISRHEATIGDLESLHVTWCGELHQHKFERDAKYDQPIFIYLDRLSAGACHGLQRIQS